MYYLLVDIDSGLPKHQQDLKTLMLVGIQIVIFCPIGIWMKGVNNSSS